MVFEKFAAFVFLFLLVGVVLFLTYVPLPEASEQVVLIVIGALTGAASQALPRLFGVKDNEAEALRRRVKALEAKNTMISEQYNEIIQMLVDRHVVYGEGNRPDLMAPKDKPPKPTEA